jgi:hypothetical protein
MRLLAGETALLLGLGLGTAFLIAIVVAGLGAVFSALFDGGEDDAADVQRFIDLTDEARSLVPPGLPLLDHDRAAATAAAIVRFQAKKDEARRPLWASRAARRVSASRT